MNPPLDEATLERFEDQHRVKLPPEYRGFLISIGDGGAGPFFGLQRLADSLPGPPADVARRFVLEGPTSLRPVPRRSRLPYRQFAAGSDARDGCLEICHQGCANYELLTVTGDAPGRIWLAEAAGVLVPRNQSFLDWYEEWLDEG